MQQTSLVLRIAALLTGTIVAHSSVRAYGADDNTASRPKSREQAMTRETLPIACNIAALNPLQRRHHVELIKQLRAAVKETKELPDGYAFRYSAEPSHLMAAAEFITQESRCCSFFHFSLAVESHGGPMWLRITGPTEAKSIIKAMFVP